MGALLMAERDHCRVRVGIRHKLYPESDLQLIARFDKSFVQFSRSEPRWLNTRTINTRTIIENF